MSHPFVNVASQYLLELLFVTSRILTKNVHGGAAFVLIKNCDYSAIISRLVHLCTRMIVNPRPIDRRRRSSLSIRDLPKGRNRKLAVSASRTISCINLTPCKTISRSLVHVVPKLSESFILSSKQLKSPECNGY